MNPWVAGAVGLGVGAGLAYSFQRVLGRQIVMTVPYGEAVQGRAFIQLAISQGIDAKEEDVDYGIAITAPGYQAQKLADLAAQVKKGKIQIPPVALKGIGSLLTPMGNSI